ncbi:MAG TPA: hypothetical protein VK789_18525 [Bryobacteraceae bacterium]|jgi:hypothetical protein|nr:hypothetical protein [Bryobacteraceae bacterium]
MPPALGLIEMNTSALPHCIDCDIYLSRYESATFDLVKIANALDLAEHRYDPESVQQLRREYQNALEKQAHAQGIFTEHQSSHDTASSETQERIASGARI